MCNGIYNDCTDRTRPYSDAVDDQIDSVLTCVFVIHRVFYLKVQTKHKSNSSMYQVVGGKV